MLLRTRKLLFICFRILLDWEGCCSMIFSIFCYNWVFIRYRETIESAVRAVNFYVRISFLSNAKNGNIKRIKELTFNDWVTIKEKDVQWFVYYQNVVQWCGNHYSHAILPSRSIHGPACLWRNLEILKVRQTECSFILTFCGHRGRCYFDNN